MRYRPAPDKDAVDTRNCRAQRSQRRYCLSDPQAGGFSGRFSAIANDAAVASPWRSRRRQRPVRTPRRTAGAIDVREVTPAQRDADARALSPRSSPKGAQREVCTFRQPGAHVIFVRLRGSPAWITEATGAARSPHGRRASTRRNDEPRPDRRNYRTAPRWPTPWAVEADHRPPAAVAGPGFQQPPGQHHPRLNRRCCAPRRSRRSRPPILR